MVRCGAAVRWCLVLALWFVNAVLLLWLWHGSEPEARRSLLSTGVPAASHLGSSAREEAVTRSPRGQALGTASISLIMSDFEEWANAVPTTLVRSAEALSLTAGVHQAVVAAPRIPYPPIGEPEELRGKITIVSTQLGAFQDAQGTRQSRDLSFNTGLVMAVPDGLNLQPAARHVERWLRDHVFHHRQLRKSSAAASPDTCLVSYMHAMPSQATGTFDCTNAFFDVKRWTLSISSNQVPLPPRGMLASCNYSTEPMAAVLTDAATMRRLRWDQVTPLSTGLLLQAHAKGCRIKQYVAPFMNIGDETDGIFNTGHLKEKRDRFTRQRVGELYHTIGIKRIRWMDQQRDEWYGCHKNSPRCFGTVVHDTPEYIFQGRWTPPCCLEKIRQTTRYVLDVLNAAGVRYWLEGGTLLGAVRNSDIIEWDYDADLGIFSEDCDRVKELSIAKQQGRHETRDGYVWEKAVEGDFFRVQYSRFNHLHVDIFPFYERNGVMTKNTWIESHRQDMEFPSSFVTRLETLPFVGTTARVPNNPRAFLELKFGKGCVEHPRLPGPSA